MSAVFRRFSTGILCLTCLLALGACSLSGSGRQLVATDFTCAIDAQYKDMTLKGKLIRYTAGTLRIEAEEPSSLKGLTMEWDGETVRLGMHGLSFDVSPDTVPESALGRVIGSALDNAPHAEGEQTPDGLLTKGSSPAGDYELISDPDTGYIRSLRVPTQQLTVLFTDIVAASAGETGA